MAHVSSSGGRSTQNRRQLRALTAVAAALALGALTGFGAFAVLAGAALGDANDLPSLDPSRLIDATHVPPLLTASGEQVVLRYDIYCTAPDGDPESGAPCDAGGTVYVRAGPAGPFTALPLRLDARAAEGRYVADVPPEIGGAADGFAYYAVVRNRRTGTAMTLPAGGADAPHRTQPLGRAVAVELGRHVFGVPRGPSERAFAAPWGTDAAEVGLEGGRQSTPIGPASFDVDGGGTVSLLDQVNRRLLRIVPGSARATEVPLAVRGALADIAVAEDGSVHVLESTGAAPGEPPLLRTFDSRGRALGAVETAERTAAQVRMGPGGPVVKQYPSEQWLPVTNGRAGLGRLAQARDGAAARPLRDGRAVTISHRGDELRLSLGWPGSAQRSWVVRSTTQLGEVQLAEPHGSRLVVVVRAYTDERDEFVVLVLGPRGLEERFAVAAADWAETAPLSRFRLAGGALYRLGSTPAGAHVDRFALEVTR
jgi:hypothetical protein